MAEAPADRGMIGGRAQRVAHEVALVPGPRVREHAFVGAIHLRELLLEGRLSLRDPESRGPFGVGLGVDQLRLAAVDPTHERAEQSVDATPEVVVLHRELVDPLDQHRQPVAGAQRRGVKVALGPRGNPEHPCGEAHRGQHVQRLVTPLQPGLEPHPDGIGASRRRSEDEDALGPLAVIDQPAEALFDQARLPAPRAPEDELRPTGVADGLSTWGGRLLRHV